jgi:general secretion pathway protein G
VTKETEMKSGCKLWLGDELGTTRAVHRRASRRAFTLIELLLVLVILAVLAAIVIPRFTGRTEQANITATGTTLSSIESALEAFEIDNGRFPTSQEGLEALVLEPSGLPNETWKGPYLRRQEIPKDAWGNEFIYEQPGANNQNGFDLSSNGPDGQAGTEDDIVNWSEELR